MPFFLAKLTKKLPNSIVIVIVIGGRGSGGMVTAIAVSVMWQMLLTLMAIVMHRRGRRRVLDERVRRLGGRRWRWQLLLTRLTVWTGLVAAKHTATTTTARTNTQRIGARRTIQHRSISATTTTTTTVSIAAVDATAAAAANARACAEIARLRETRRRARAHREL